MGDDHGSHEDNEEDERAQGVDIAHVPVHFVVCVCVADLYVCG